MREFLCALTYVGCSAGPSFHRQATLRHLTLWLRLESAPRRYETVVASLGVRKGLDNEGSANGRNRSVGCFRTDSRAELGGEALLNQTRVLRA
jgi:hypothetical protein